MHRSGLFCRVLLPGTSLIVAASLLNAAGSLPLVVRLLLLTGLLAAAGMHAWWVASRFTALTDEIAGLIEQMGPDDASPHIGEGPPVEVASLVHAVRHLEGKFRRRISDLEAAGSEQENSSALLEAVLKTMVEGVVVLDREQRVLFANEAARPLLDVQTSDVLGRPLWEVARLSAVQEMIGRAMKDAETVQAEYEIPRTKRVVAVTATSLPQEPVPGAMLVLHDVTELRRLENTRRDFVANVSHELKTPLTSIQAYADTLLEGDFDDVEASRHFLEKIVEQSERLAAIIVDVIRLGKIESEPDLFEVKPVPVLPVVSACVESHLAVAETKGIQLRIDSPATEAAVLADAGEVRTILDNLVDNALHYTPSGGRVTVKVIDPAGGMVGIAVSDTGVGIPGEQQARVFERFHRVDRARDRQRGGTGLGLSIVKHLSQLFGGRVELESELGAGSTFTVWLPNANSVENVMTTPDADTTDANRTAQIEPASSFTDS